MSLTAEQRAERDALMRRVKAIEDPEWLEKRQARKAAKRARDKGLVRAAGQREPRLQEPLYLAFIRRLPCAVADPDCAGPIEAAHLRFSDARFGRVNSGMQAKPDDRWTLPLCRHHHQHDQHKRAERVFWESRGIDAGQLCIDLHAAFCAGEDGSNTLCRSLSWEGG